MLIDAIFSDAWNQELERFHTARVTFRAIQVHWYWCHSAGHVWLVGVKSPPTAPVGLWLYQRQKVKGGELSSYPVKEG